MLALQRIAIVAHTFRVTQIPIAERAAPSAHFTRGFVPWRLSDDGPGASRTVSMGRHPKPTQEPKWWLDVMVKIMKADPHLASEIDQSDKKECKGDDK